MEIVEEEKEKLEILYRDEYLVAINKPSGLLVHRSMIDRHETRFAIQILRDQIGQYVYPLHRLDKPTSGVLLFALDKERARDMSELFKSREVKKNYMAIVRGYTKEEEIIDYPLKEILDKMTDKKVNQDKEAQEAITQYQRLETIELPLEVGPYKTARYSLVSISPQTGRKHQLRRHFKHIFHPIVGDTTHGDLRHTKLFRDKLDTHRLLLHANSVIFQHPISNMSLKIDAPFDVTFNQLFLRFKWDY